MSQLLVGIDGARVVGGGNLRDARVGGVRDDSRLVAPGELFVAVQGASSDGRRFVADAAARGAAAIVLEGEPPPELAAFKGAVVVVPNARRALAIMAANRFRGAGASTVPAPALSAVTGTNGKTTTTYILEQMLQAAGASPGVIGTVSYRAAAWAGGARPAPLTTPGALALHELIAEMAGAGTTDVVLEASSHALEQGRLDGCSFRVAAMTNVTQDHLDYHGTMARYFDAKAILFERLIDARRGVAVTFADDEDGRRMDARARAPARVRVARGAGAQARGADVVVEARSLGADGTRATLATPLGRLEIASTLVGEYNLSNLAIAVGMAVARELPADAIVAGAARVAVPGRLERVANDRGVLCVVDYAHTPDALERAIAAMRPLVAPGRRLIAVFGCGGDRDRGKRPLMGEIAARGADLAVVTSDNPRTEDPAAIVAEIVVGMAKAGVPELDATALGSSARGALVERGTLVEIDRRAAIALAIGAASAGDVVLIAGKGHEDYQIVGTTKTHFDDREEAAAAFAIGTP